MSSSNDPEKSASAPDEKINTESETTDQQPQQLNVTSDLVDESSVDKKAMMADRETVQEVTVQGQQVSPSDNDTNTNEPENRSKDASPPASLAEALEFVKEGNFFYKVREPNRFYWRKYHVDIDNLRLHYIGGRKPIICSSSPFIELIDAIEVRKGWNTDRFKKLEKVSQLVLNGDCFSLNFPSCFSF